jgi:hypothetical protein
MKTRFILFAFLLLCITGLNAQTGWFGGPGVPLKLQSPLFGKDIVIKDSSNHDQRNVVICSAYNGWLYAAIAYTNGWWGNVASYSILKSVDNGITWVGLVDGSYGAEGGKFTSLDIIAIGNSISSIKVIISTVNSYGTSLIGDAFVRTYDGSTGELIDQPFQSPSVYDIALASDLMFPAENSNPFSVGILISRYRYNGGNDSILFRSSSNGGISIDHRLAIAGSTSNFHKVALTYGRCSSYPSGRYFAAWEEQNGVGNQPGHIYTAHSEPNFNSPFTIPVQLDTLDPSALNMCRNPKISCQYSNADNDSANLTEVVLFEKYNPSDGDYDVTGFYNLQSTTTSHFRQLNIATTSNNELQPDISFNPYNSNFLVTYFDSTTKKLPFLTNDVNLASPNSWTVVSQGYNDNGNLVAPYPKVDLNYGKQEGMNAWISEEPGGNGIAMYDAQYLFPVGVSESSTGSSAKLIEAYPNPCSNTINFSFELKKAGKVTIDVTSIVGQPIGTVTDQIYPAGKQVVHYDVSTLPVGNYLYKFRSGEFTATGKFAVIR